MSLPRCGPVAETYGIRPVGYRLPVLELIRTADEEGSVGHLGPDLLGPGWDPDADPPGV